MIRDYTNLSFYNFTFLERSGKNKWWAKCSCGEIRAIVPSQVVRGDRKKCSSCVKRSLKPLGEMGFNALYHAYKTRGQRKKGFSLSTEEFRKLVTANCFYCGLPPSQILQPHRKYSSFVYNGIDRKDNALGYHSENCLTCCKQCNFAKGKQSFEFFLCWLEQVKAHKILNV